MAEQKESGAEEGRRMPDRVHMMLRIPAKYAVSQGGGLHQGQERDSLDANACKAETELRRTEFPGQGPLRFDGGPGRAGGSGLHQEAEDTAEQFQLLR